MIDTITTEVIWSLLLFQALVIIVLRFYVKVITRNLSPNLSDYLVVIAWLMVGAWLLLTYTSLNLGNSDNSDSQVVAMKMVFASYYCFELGLYFPKASILAFYWSLFPRSSTDLRLALNIAIAFFVAAFTTAGLILTLWCSPISNNWSLTDNGNAIWADAVWIPFYVCYSMNISTDLLVFCLPFLMFRRLRLTSQEKINLIGVFSLGAVTIAVSVARFVYGFLDLDFNSSALLCTAEITVAITVVCLPHLRPLFRRTPPNSLEHSPTASSENKELIFCGIKHVM